MSSHVCFTHGCFSEEICAFFFVYFLTHEAKIHGIHLISSNVQGEPNELSMITFTFHPGGRNVNMFIKQISSDF